MVDFGWSASCILEAIKLSNKIRKALKEAGGAKEQYNEATSFLNQFEVIFQELERHVRDSSETCYREALVQEMKLMEPPWSRLQSLLVKYETSLGEDASKSKLSKISRKVQWALKDLNDAVRKERAELRGPLQTMSLLLQMQSINTIRDTNEKCQKIVGDIEASQFATSLQLEIEELHRQGGEMIAYQEGNEASFALLKQSLTLQHSEVLDALQRDREARDALASNEPHANELNALATLSLEDTETFGDSETAYNIIQDQLRAQQARLDDLHEALQRLATDLSNATETMSSKQPTEAVPLDAITPLSVVQVVATAASIFMLGITSKSSLPNNGQSIPCTQTERRVDYARFDDQGSQLNGKTELHLSWTTEFIASQELAKQNDVSDTRVSPAQPDQDGTADISVASDPFKRHYWRCCHCDEGYQHPRFSKCRACSKTRCEGCPRTAFERNTFWDEHDFAAHPWFCCACIIDNWKEVETCRCCDHERCECCPPCDDEDMCCRSRRKMAK